MSGPFVPGQVGWKPRYSPDGYRLTWERANYWQAQWLDETTEIGHDGFHLIVGGQATTFPAGNEIAAGGGRWAVWRPDPIRILPSWREPIRGAGRPAINPAGAFAYVDDYHGAITNLLYEEQIVSRGPISDPRCSRQALVWSNGGQTWGCLLRDGLPGNPVTDLARRIQAAQLEFRPIPIDTPEGPWVLNHTQTGIILRAFGDTAGYRFDNGGQTYYPDAVLSGHRQITAIFTNGQGIQDQHVFDLTAPRVPLGAIASAPPPQAPPRVPGPVTNAPRLPHGATCPTCGLVMP